MMPSHWMYCVSITRQYMMPSHWMYCVSIIPLLERVLHDAITLDVLCKYNSTVREGDTRRHHTGCTV